MHPLLYAVLLFPAIFFLLMIYLSLTTLFHSKKSPLPMHDGAAGISIVIPFCNEAPRLAVLLESLLIQDYRGPYEIVLVNDGSNDDYVKAISPFLQSPPHPIRLIHSNFNKQKKLTSKQQALDQGVSAAAHPYCAFTDADMEFDREWLGSLAKMIPGGDDLVFGHTAVRKAGRNLFIFLQAYQLEFLFAAAYAFHLSRFPGSCMGNNLLVRKKAYLDIGGQEGIGYSIVEDRALLSSFKRHGMKVTPVHPFRAMAETYPCNNLLSFASQVFRWGRGGFLEQYDLLPTGILFFSQYGFLIIALCEWTSGVLWAISFANFGITLFFVWCAFRKMDSKENVCLFPVYYAFLLVEIIAFLCSFAAWPALSWKNRKL